MWLLLLSFQASGDSLASPDLIRFQVSLNWFLVYASSGERQSTKSVERKTSFCLRVSWWIGLPRKRFLK